MSSRYILVAFSVIMSLLCGCALFMDDGVQSYVEIKNITKTSVSNLSKSEYDLLSSKFLPEESRYLLSFQITAFGSSIFVPNRVSNVQKNGFFYSAKLKNDEYNTNILSKTSGKVFSVYPTNIIKFRDFYVVTNGQTAVFNLLVFAIGPDSSNLNLELDSFWCSEDGGLYLEDGERYNRYNIGYKFSFSQIDQKVE